MSNFDRLDFYTVTRPKTRFHVIYSTPNTSGSWTTPFLSEAQRRIALLTEHGGVDWWLVNDDGEVMLKGKHRIGAAT